MKSGIRILFLLLVAVSTWSVALASDNTSQIVTFGVQAVNEIALAGDLNITNENTVTINSQSVKVIHATSTYLITTNEEHKKITGVLNTVLPKDANLFIALEAPTGAVSVGGVSLKSTPIDLVTGVSRVAESQKVIHYTFTTPVTTQSTTPLSQMITLTITN
jgi:hypothetical protein